MSITEEVAKKTEEFVRAMPKEWRKPYGQFFTKPQVASFMASLFEEVDKKKISILDPGAGTGILSVALIERLERCPSIERIRVVCYENDPLVIPLLKSNLDLAKRVSTKSIDYEIVQENYVLTQGQAYSVKDIFGSESKEVFDYVIGNPPYKKLPKDAPECIVMKDICHGSPNLYFLFAELSLFNLKKGGELVYIIPRSWTSGAYFTSFRQKFLDEGKLKHIHLFERRDDVFNCDKVLQETIIVKVIKTKEVPCLIKISSSLGDLSFNEMSSLTLPYSMVVSEEANKYIHLPVNELEVKAYQLIRKLPYTLPEIGLRMKTGLTVDFRNKASLRNGWEKEAIPLFYSQHIQAGKVKFPIGKENEYLVTNRSGLRQKNENYLFLKRFTTKEEKRRLQCGIYLKRDYPQFSEISTQNKINFICGKEELSENIVYGLYVLFNSSIYDLYFRTLNGSTQVNSTEINSMPVPSLSTIEAMGRKIFAGGDYSEKACNEILKSYVWKI